MRVNTTSAKADTVLIDIDTTSEAVVGTLWNFRYQGTQSVVLINIDNGGTFTDVCVIDGQKTFRAKTPTTPFDLSECFFEGLRKVSAEIYGQENLGAMLGRVSKIRYSTTQGTNALVQRNGPRLGLILEQGADAGAMQSSAKEQDLYASLVGERVAFVDFALSGDAFDAHIVNLINELTLAGANRLVLSVADQDREARLEQVISERFPEHLLGTVPAVSAGLISRDQNLARRTWTAIFNAFLHPSMEKFLFYAENRLRERKFLSPLLIYRNDGDSGRVAKTVAIKSYSSGPRGGMDGVAALARHYGYQEVLSMDVGGTTTDIGLFKNGDIRKREFGQVEGVEIAFPLTDIVSAGVGGGSKIRAADSNLLVGPDSVGAAPGPACFGLGGSDATITDFALLAGFIDPATYFGGAMALDADRARRAVDEHVAQPLGLNPDAALVAMKDAWVAKVAKSLVDFAEISEQTVLAAFGGAGPLVVCSVAEAAGIQRIIIPRLAPVFCGFGIGFSDVGHSYEVEVPRLDSSAAFVAWLDGLKGDALQDMAAEGFDAAQCRFEFAVVEADDKQRQRTAFESMEEGYRLTSAQPGCVLGLRVCAELERPVMEQAAAVGSAASPVSSADRDILLHAGQRQPVPLFVLDQQPCGAQGQGPAVIEDPFFTLTVQSGWGFEISSSGDILLTHQGEQR